MWENIKLSLRGIRSHKMRSFLTMLGIIIGIAAIIAIVAVIDGTNAQIQKNLIGSGTNTVKVALSQDGYPVDVSQVSGVPQVSDNTMSSLAGIEHVESAAKYLEQQDYNNLVWHNAANLQSGYVRAIDENYLYTAGLEVVNGRGFSEQDIKKASAYVLLDDGAVKSLFDGNNPVGKTIEISSIPFTVIGTVQTKNNYSPVINSIDDYYMYHQEETGAVYMPLTAWPLCFTFDAPENVLLHVDQTDNISKAGKTAADFLNVELINTTYQYKAMDVTEQAQEIQNLNRSMNLMLLAIASISLLVGGIGVMNIMLVSVTERTREIGLKKAIGARKKDIMTQFLTESVVLTSFGGILGVLTGILLAYMIGRIATMPIAISARASVFAVLFSMAIGILFGILPARKAANMDPIEALRRE